LVRRILMAKFMLAIAVCFGPIFIMCLMFDSCASCSRSGLARLSTSGLITILLSATFGLLMKFYGKAVAASADPAANSPILVPIITCGLLTVVTWFVLKKIPDLAASWGSGVSVQFVPGRQHEQRWWGQGASQRRWRRCRPLERRAAGAGGGAAAQPVGAAAEPLEQPRSAVGSAMQGMARGSRRAG
jgi:type IV secretion system protein VirB6